ncbi:MAG: ImmA/IrrE family metallo-endopeptidase [Burkholderiaceae bacterium]|nr:ImmA/IrrE family metallo-endopeptidase [Burkholderiaceae bacterium]
MFERGFKTWCEKYAVDARSELNLKSSDPLDPRKLAANLKIRVWTPDQVPGLSAESLQILLRNDGKSPSCWSAVTLVVGTRIVVVLNSSHSKGRQSSDLMHELSHRIRGHETHDMEASPAGIMLLSAYDKKQEEEADWLSGCLLLPREALVWIKGNHIDPNEAAQIFGVSKRMLDYRMAMTGVNRQYA